MTTFAGFIYQFSYGISIASTTFVGNEMGRKEIEMAKLYTKATFIIDFLFLFILLCPMAIFGSDLIKFVSKDQIVL
jgi:MATE family multidrug resistance protein